MTMFAHEQVVLQAKRCPEAAIGPNLPTMEAGAAEGDLALFGVDRAGEALYRAVLRHSGEPLTVLSDRTGVLEADLPERLRPLADLRLVRLIAAGDGGPARVVAEPPDLALGRLVGDQAQQVRRLEQRLAAARAAIPDLVATHEQARGADWYAASVEVIESDDLVPAMETLLHNSTGELLFLRPDQYALSSGRSMDAVVLEALRAGRRSRSLYPAAVADDVPDSVRERALAGEEVRVVPVVPARMGVFGSEAAVVTEHWGDPVGRRLLVRQPALVGALVALFDAYWERAVVLPGFADRSARESPESELLSLLARGAKDEQVARVLGVSLRTVRRRIAALLVELGAESRFQAGMEAVRRGLL
jgi:DNA-binding CsgD family transcriptional regulator